MLSPAVGLSLFAERMPRRIGRISSADEYRPAIPRPSLAAVTAARQPCLCSGRTSSTVQDTWEWVAACCWSFSACCANPSGRFALCRPKACAPPLRSGGTPEPRHRLQQAHARSRTIATPPWALGRSDLSRRAMRLRYAPDTLPARFDLQAARRMPVWIVASADGGRAGRAGTAPKPAKRGRSAQAGAPTHQREQTSVEEPVDP